MNIDKIIKSASAEYDRIWELYDPDTFPQRKRINNIVLKLQVHAEVMRTLHKIGDLPD